MKIANVDREILHNFSTTWGISIKFSGKMCLMIILKVTKNQGITLCLEDTIFEKPQGGIKLIPPLPSRFRVKVLLLTDKNSENYMQQIEIYKTVTFIWYNNTF